MLTNGPFLKIKTHLNQVITQDDASNYLPPVTYTEIEGANDFPLSNPALIV